METNNNYFIVNMAERVMNGDSTLFLNQAELKRLTRILNKNKCKYEVLITMVILSFIMVNII